MSSAYVGQPHYLQFTSERAVDDAYRAPRSVTPSSRGDSPGRSERGRGGGSSGVSFDSQDLASLLGSKASDAGSTDRRRRGDSKSRDRDRSKSPSRSSRRGSRGKDRDRSEDRSRRGSSPARSRGGSKSKGKERSPSRSKSRGRKSTSAASDGGRSKRSASKRSKGKRDKDEELGLSDDLTEPLTMVVHPVLFDALNEEDVYTHALLTDEERLYALRTSLILLAVCGLVSMVFAIAMLFAWDRV